MTRIAFLSCYDMVARFALGDVIVVAGATVPNHFDVIDSKYTLPVLGCVASFTAIRC